MLRAKESTNYTFPILVSRQLRVISGNCLRHMVRSTELSLSSAVPCKRLSLTWIMRSLHNYVLTLLMAMISIRNSLKSSFLMLIQPSLTHNPNSSANKVIIVIMIATIKMKVIESATVEVASADVDGDADEVATLATRDRTRTAMTKEISTTTITTTTMTMTTMMKKIIATRDQGKRTLATTRNTMILSETTEETAEVEVAAAATTTEVATAGATTEATMIETKETIRTNQTMIETKVHNNLMTTRKPRTRRESYTLATSTTTQMSKVLRKLLVTLVPLNASILGIGAMESPSAMLKSNSDQREMQHRLSRIWTAMK